MTLNLQARLSDHKAKQLYRIRRARSSTETLVNFSNNDYLGLSQHPEVIKTFQQAAESYGVGSGASQLVTGHTTLHQECEHAFAEFLQQDRALLFGNGYMANLGVQDALAQHGDAIYQDRYNHASLLDAGRLSNAKSFRYFHKNMGDLTQRLSQHTTGKRFIVSDGVFSMHGDIAPLKKLTAVSKTYPSTLIIDDAHGIGVLGKTGRGSCEQAGLSQNDVPVLVCPLGKAFGVYGAIVAGNEELIETLIQFSRSYIYTTALPPALAAAAIKSLEVLQRETWRRETLHQRIAFFRKKANERHFDLVDSETAIQAIRIGEPKQAVQLSEQLERHGFRVYPMRPPSVPDGQSMLRITMNALHTEQQIINLLEALG